MVNNGKFIIGFLLSEEKEEAQQASRLKAGIVQLSEWHWSLGQNSRNRMKCEFEVVASNCSAVSI